MTQNTTQHLASSVIMVNPVDFGFNEQTGLDNKFQQRPSANELNQINQLVRAEFENAVKTLQDLNIEILILEKEHTNASLPDAIFPNNWFCTCTNGDVHIFPMKTKNRQDEVQIPQLTALVKNSGYKLNNIIDLRVDFASKGVLEGTGSIIFHHPSQTIFAALSERCQQAPLELYADQFQYELVSFNSSSSGSPVYHTNVLMSCGGDFAVIASPVIQSNNRKYLLNKLEETVGELVIISEEQMANNFCGNILQLQDDNQHPVIALSQSAYSGFNLDQRKFLESKGSLAVCNIPTIERIGGGSSRCMLAENFLPKTSN